MVECIFCCDSLGWVIFENFFKQVNKIGPIFWHFKSQVEVLFLKVIEGIQYAWLIGDSFLEIDFLSLGHIPQSTCNCKQLIALSLSLEKWRQSVEFSQYASSCPHIDRCGVFSQAQNEFRSTIVARNYVRSVFSIRVDNFTASEIADLHFALFRQQHILGLEVSMANVVLVNVFEPIQQLVDVFLKIKLQVPLSNFPLW